jgi:hypothetical protein
MQANSAQRELALAEVAPAVQRGGGADVRTPEKIVGTPMY